MKLLKRIGLLLIPILGIIIYTNYPKLNLISGFASKNMASSVFIAERSADYVANNDNNMPLVKLANVKLNTKDQSTTGWVYGLMA